jgi:DNA-binding response OmpR family regulator
MSPMPTSISLTQHPGRVLVAQRDERSSAALRLIVEYDGHAVRQTHASREIIPLFQQFRPHVLLLDPTLWSGALLAALEVATSGEGPASVILTSGDDRVDRRALRWIAARVSRPFDFMQLRQLVSGEVARLSA